MKESYEARPSQSPWPRVILMRDAGQPSLRNLSLARARRCGLHKGFVTVSPKRCVDLKVVACMIDNPCKDLQSWFSLRTKRHLRFRSWPRTRPPEVVVRVPFQGFCRRGSHHFDFIIWWEFAKVPMVPTRSSNARKKQGLNPPSILGHLIGFDNLSPRIVNRRR